MGALLKDVLQSFLRLHDEKLSVMRSLTTVTKLNVLGLFPQSLQYFCVSIKTKHKQPRSQGFFLELAKSPGDEVEA